MTRAQAWQPMTPRGVAAFAYATFSRLALVQLAVALLVAFFALWIATSLWFPVVEEAIHDVPSETSLRNGALISGVSGPQRLAGNRALEIVLDAHRRGGSGGSADLTLILAEREVFLCGVLGCASIPYPAGYDIVLERESAEPWWGAWRKAVAAAIVATVVVAMFVIWWASAVALAGLVRLLAFFMDRVLSTAGSARLAAAAMLPGAAILILGMALYAMGAIDLVRLGLLFAVNVVCGLVFVFTTPLFLERIGAKKANPFVEKAAAASQPPKPGERANPFRDGSAKP